VTVLIALLVSGAIAAFTQGDVRASGNPPWPQPAITSPWLFSGSAFMTQDYGCSSSSWEPVPPDGRCSSSPLGLYWHTGIDIAGGSVQCGTVFYGGQHGVATTVQVSPSFSGIEWRLDDHNYVVIYHSQYSYISSNPPSQISRGTPIGQVGSYGNSSGCHIHFEIDGPGHSPGRFQDWTDIDPRAELAWQGTTEQLTVARRPTGPELEDLFIRGATPYTADGGSIRPLHGATDESGQPKVVPLPWEEIGNPPAARGLVLGSPTGVWNSTTTRLDVFAIGTDHTVYHDAYAGSGWGSWTGVSPSGSVGISGAALTEMVTADRLVVTGGYIDIFIRGTNGHAQHAKLNPDGTSPTWEDLGGIVKGAPSGRWDPSGYFLDVFAIGGDDHPYHNRFNRSTGTWTGWLGPLMGTAATAGTEMIMTVSRPSGILDLFVEGIDGLAYHYWTDTSGVIQGYDGVGAGQVMGAPDGKWNTAGSRIDVFAIEADNTTYRNWYFGGWNGWTQLPGGGVWK
jgi:hypothetical protein